MSYTVHNFASGDVIHAEDLNEMDAQIAANEEASTVDATLSQEGKPADAKAVGDEITDIKSQLDAKQNTDLDITSVNWFENVTDVFGKAWSAVGGTFLRFGAGKTLNDWFNDVSSSMYIWTDDSSGNGSVTGRTAITFALANAEGVVLSSYRTLYSDTTESFCTTENISPSNIRGIILRAGANASTTITVDNISTVPNNTGSTGDEYISETVDRAIKQIKTSIDDLQESAEISQTVDTFLALDKNYVISNNKINQTNYIGKTIQQINDVPIYFPNGVKMSDIASGHLNVKVYLSVAGSTSLSSTVFYFVDGNGNNITSTLTPNQNYNPVGYSEARGIKIHGYSNAPTGAIDEIGVLFDNSTYDTYETTIKTKKTIFDNTWCGKKWISYGDSITQGNTWQPFVVNALELVHINKGIGGSTVASNPDDSVAPFCDSDRIATLDSDADLITIMGGTNDYNGTNEGAGTPLGALPTSSTYNTTEFYGALCQTVRLIQQRCPNALIIIMSIINSRGVTGEASDYPLRNAIGLTSGDYSKACEEVANYLGCAFIDMAKCGINIYNRTKYISDGVHPNSAGGEMMSRMVIDYLTSHLPND